MKRQKRYSIFWQIFFEIFNPQTYICYLLEKFNSQANICNLFRDIQPSGKYFKSIKDIHPTFSRILTPLLSKKEKGKMYKRQNDKIWYRVSLKKRYFSIFHLICVREIGFYLFTSVFGVKILSPFHLVTQIISIQNLNCPQNAKKCMRRHGFHPSI